MRVFADIEQRWSLLFNTSIGVDLRQAIREGGSFDPCEDGLRSVCWRAFLLYGPLSTGSWTKKLVESRSAYVSLRDHFLKYINNPDDLHSSIDPLADDETSPWSSLRQDETDREEIFQDVTRCMQDNYFFREPTVQKKLLDILFIYSKLNPDTGYRQGMHELLAPIVWVISHDAVDLKTCPGDIRAKEGVDLMLDVLDQRYIEHDAFNLFCAVMQTAKGFYDMGENKDSSAIVTQSNRIHHELLTAVDPDLAHRLQVVGVLPQIYSIRWIRLLFGREFEFVDVLKVWDLLFAENLALDIIDMTCVAMLLRIRWQLIEADYTTAITTLNRFQLPKTNEGPRSLVKDAVTLNRHRTLECGASLISQYSGRRPRISNTSEDRSYSPATSQQRYNPKRWSQPQSSPSRSPARFSTPQKQLESMFQEVSGNLQKKAEGWGVSKAVRGAVGEVRKNINSLQVVNSRALGLDATNPPPIDQTQMLQERLQTLEARNKALAKMLDGALSSLRACRPGSTNDSTKVEDAFNISLARIQFVSVYLADAEIPIPAGDEDTKAPENTDGGAEKVMEVTNTVLNPSLTDSKLEDSAGTDIAPETVLTPGQSEPSGGGTSDQLRADLDTGSSGVKQMAVRPSLMDSSFSFMLGENRHRSSFVSSVSTLPEQQRDTKALVRPKQKSVDSKSSSKMSNKVKIKDKHDVKQPRPDDDGFTLSSFR